MIGWQRAFRPAPAVSALGRARLLRHGFIVSAFGHAGFLATSLLFVHASSVAPMLPDAMPVEIVEVKEPPRLSGTPSPLRQSGTETDAKAESLNKVTQPPQPDQPPKPQQERRPAKQSPQQKTREPPTAPEPPQIVPPGMGKIVMAQPPDASEETPDDTGAAQTLAQLALMGGRLGGGFAAPAIGSPLVGYDFTLFFRERVSACTARPPSIDPSEDIRIRTRVFLNRDGTLAGAPQLLEPNPSAKQQALMASFVSGLNQCQPYSMLPKERYKEWKTLELMVYPMNAPGG